MSHRLEVPMRSAGADTIAPTPQARRDADVSHADRTDEELIALAQAGDEAAFGDFVNRHVASVHRWMIRAVGESDADDMTQDVFLKAYRGLPHFRREAPPRAWLASIADNAVKNRYRSLSRFRRVFAPQPAQDAPAADPPERSAGPEGQARAGEARRFVAEALKLLPVEFRMPVVLRDLEQWSYDEIAVSLNLPVGTVKSRIARGRGQLKTILSPMLNGTLP
ncbi:MAG: RNA polymerase sigma factor [Thermoanaerobaculia bacterium]